MNRRLRCTRYAFVPQFPQNFMPATEVPHSVQNFLAPPLAPPDAFAGAIDALPEGSAFPGSCFGPLRGVWEEVGPAASPPRL
eukprot:CAMPEP_0119124486 /NCGR_PEP_ID=MMETSP1310-20130426/4099_1 /TAXON_ID=464262 /ORGANISM="Genus nov. species nov., Strain RCC2339" /LENGTH=81 /DNA_ID=CAMNT_0007114447 /DNA_START=53 /DNA_END=298 /DNA_ORIENTATION=+